MNPEEAMSFLADHGVILEAARGPVPNLAEVIAGEPIRGSWWSHPQSHTIYSIFQAVRANPAVIVCRLVDGKITYVHERLWPAVACLAAELDNRRIAVIREKHTPSGAHRVVEIPFFESVPVRVQGVASRLSRGAAISLLGPWILPLLGVPFVPPKRRLIPKKRTMS